MNLLLAVRNALDVIRHYNGPGLPARSGMVLADGYIVIDLGGFVPVPHAVTAFKAYGWTYTPEYNRIGIAMRREDGPDETAFRTAGSVRPEGLPAPGIPGGAESPPPG